jgi:hypothetical protein
MILENLRDDWTPDQKNKSDDLCMLSLCVLCVFCNLGPSLEVHHGQCLTSMILVDHEEQRNETTLSYVHRETVTSIA